MVGTTLQEAPMNRNQDNTLLLLEDFLLHTTGGEDRLIETSYDKLVEAAHSYVFHLADIIPDTKVVVDFVECDAPSNPYPEGA